MTRHGAHERKAHAKALKIDMPFEMALARLLAADRQPKDPRGIPVRDYVTPSRCDDRRRG